MTRLLLKKLSKVRAGTLLSIECTVYCRSDPVQRLSTIEIFPGETVMLLAIQDVESTPGHWAIVFVILAKGSVLYAQFGHYTIQSKCGLPGHFHVIKDAVANSNVTAHRPSSRKGVTL